MKVIFLDVDGVLRHDFYEGTKEDYGIDPEKLKLLKEIIDKTKAKIVLSSTWRRGIDQTGKIRISELYYILEKKLKKYNIEIYSEIPKPVNIGDNPENSISIGELIADDDDDNDRAEYIAMWLRLYPEVESFVILDDFGGWKKYNLEEHVVRTSQYNGGLLPEHVEEAINILNKPKVKKR